jgi:TonB-dependent starch-binding outer membrane protein SusC
MNKFLKPLVPLIVALISVATVFGQTGGVRGVVTDRSTGESLPGANVLIKGTLTGASTSFDGAYLIENIAVGTIELEASFVGFLPSTQSVQIVAGQIITVNFVLSVDAVILEETVVIGYGVQKKSDRTGAVAHITSEEMNTGVLTDPVAGIQGKIAGVMVTKKGGDPNAGFEIKIRGASSLTTSTSPLFVVDGIPGVDPTTIAPEDIESWNILKDASSSAIYGSRGAHGVVIITTKRGTQIKRGSEISFNSYLSTDMVSNRLNLLSADQVRKYVADNNIANFNDGGANTNWMDEIYRTGMSQNYNLSIAGRDEHAAYRASLSHSNFDGVMIGSNKERTIARLNLDQTALDGRLKMQAGISGTFEKNNYINYGGWGRNSIQFQAFQRNPTDRVYNSPTDPLFATQGRYHEINRDFDYFNPVALVNEIQDERSAKRFFGFFKADMDIYRGFSAGVNLGYTRDDQESFYFEPSTLYMGTQQGFGRRAYGNFESKVLESTIRYVNDFGAHSVNFVGGHSWQEDLSTGFAAQGRGPFLNYVQSNDLSNLLSVNAGDISSYKGTNRLISFFGRGMYNYNSKYFFTATIRHDGSSKFGKNNYWGWFPSASMMWNITGEDFMSGITDVLSNLRLRVGYGISGNQEFERYKALEYYIQAGNTINFETGENAILYRFEHAANPDLRWESNAELNIGIDFGLWQDKISGSVEYFQKNTYDLLGEYSVPVPPYAVGRIFMNIGQIQVNGFEMFVQAYPVKTRNFDWKTSLVFTTFKQEVKKLSGGDFEWSAQRVGGVGGRGLVGDNTQVVQEGLPLGTWYMNEYAGLSADGKWLFYTAAGGVTRFPENAELRPLGNAQPDFELGWANYFNFYRHFDMSFSVRAVYGHQIFNTTRLFFGNPRLLPTLNVIEDALDEAARGLDDIPRTSSYFLEDGSFIRLDNLSIGYNIRNLSAFKNIRVYFASNNLLTITKYSGIDPEISFSGLSFGLDQYDVYPKTRTFTFGISVTL